MRLAQFSYFFGLPLFQFFYSFVTIKSEFGQVILITLFYVSKFISIIPVNPKGNIILSIVYRKVKALNQSFYILRRVGPYRLKPIKILKYISLWLFHFRYLRSYYTRGKR
jgi:hypothetical protein